MPDVASEHDCVSKETKEQLQRRNHEDEPINATDQQRTRCIDREKL